MAENYELKKKLAHDRNNDSSMKLIEDVDMFREEEKEVNFIEDILIARGIPAIDGEENKGIEHILSPSNVNYLKSI